MGVEYRYYLIPRDNTYRPSPEAVGRLIEAWRDSKFAVRPGSPEHTALDYESGSINYAHAATTGASLHTSQGWRGFSDTDIGRVGNGELVLQWPVTRTVEREVRHPLGLIDEEDGVYFDLELHFSDDFVEVCSEVIDPMDTGCSECDEPLGYSLDVGKPDVFRSSRIRRTCPKCKTEFRPQDRTATYHDGMTCDESDLQGGATYRFAIVIDCGKCWQTETSGDVAPAATEEFVSVSSKALGIPLYGVGDFY